MTAKDKLDIATKIASLVLATIAVSPFLKKARDMIRFGPRMTVDEHLERLKLRRRMGWFQRGWEEFLWWARRERDEVLSWKEWRARVFWCPFVLGHKGKVLPWDGGGYGLLCARCRDFGTGDTEALVEAWRKKGRETWRAKSQRVRDEPDEDRGA
jgi:hypothetical protein